MCLKIKILISSFLVFCIKKCLKVYKIFISPLLGPRCRFFPTCSEYALEAFSFHGILKGCLLTLKRLLRCHPWGSYGYDPVPPSVKNPLKERFFKRFET